MERSIERDEAVTLVRAQHTRSANKLVVVGAGEDDIVVGVLGTFQRRKFGLSVGNRSTSMVFEPKMGLPACVANRLVVTFDAEYGRLSVNLAARTSSAFERTWRCCSSRRLAWPENPQLRRTAGLGPANATVSEGMRRDVVHITGMILLRVFHLRRPQRMQDESHKKYPSNHNHDDEVDHEVLDQLCIYTNIHYRVCGMLLLHSPRMSWTRHRKMRA